MTLYAHHRIAFLQCKKYPNEVSLIEREPAKGVRREITWLEFEKEANRFSNALIECGIKQEIVLLS